MAPSDTGAPCPPAADSTTAVDGNGHDANTTTRARSSSLQPPSFIIDAHHYNHHQHNNHIKHHQAHPISTPNHRQVTEPFFLDNNFSSPGGSSKRDSIASVTGFGARSNSPVFFIHTVEGDHRPLQDEDYKNGGLISASDSGESDLNTEITFQSIQTVEDGGLGEYEPQVGKSVKSELESPSSSEASSPTLKRIPTDSTLAQVLNETPPTEDPRARRSSRHDPLEGVGGSFAPLQGGASASSEELSKFLESELGPMFFRTTEARIHQAVEESAFESSEYIPLSKLCNILNKTTTRKLLSHAYPRYRPQEIEACVKNICGPGIASTGRRKILAILVLLNMVEQIVHFIKIGVLDLHLPLEVEWDKTNKKFKIYKKDDDSLPNPLPCCNDWPNHAMHSFKTYQPMMLAPFFMLPRNEIYYYKLSKDYVLPFLVYERKVNSSYGRVMRVRMHRAHHNFKSEGLPDENPFFALKALHSHEPADFKKEVEVLQKFSGANEPNPHLIRLLLAFRHGDTHYLLFNWADGNLKQFWSSYPKPSINRNNARWVMKQCLGLAKALRKIHRATSDSWPPKNGVEKDKKDDSHLHEDESELKDYGRHGDIKPENILWFAKEHRLVITDFGLSRYHSLRSKSHDPNESLEGYSPTYRPPECDMRRDITPRYDIWALGCVFLEFISWFIAGNEATVVMFEGHRVEDDINVGHVVKEDKFFNVERDDEGKRYPVVKGSVKKWFRRLHADDKCPGFAHQVLDMIEDHLLVPDSSGRWECAAIVRELTQISNQCEESKSFCAKGTPRRSVQININGPIAESLEPSKTTTIESNLHAAQAMGPVLENPDDFFPRPKEINNNGVTSGVDSDFAGQVMDEEVSQDEWSAEASPERDADPEGGETTGITLLDPDAVSIEEVEQMGSELITYASILDQEEDENADDEYEASINVPIRPSRRSAEGRKPPKLVTDGTFQTSQDSGDAEGVYSADTTPPFMSQAAEDSMTAMEGIIGLDEMAYSNHDMANVATHQQQQAGSVSDITARPKTGSTSRPESIVNKGGCEQRSYNEEDTAKKQSFKATTTGDTSPGNIDTGHAGKAAAASRLPNGHGDGAAVKASPAKNSMGEGSCGSEFTHVEGKQRTKGSMRGFVHSIFCAWKLRRGRGLRPSRRGVEGAEQLRPPLESAKA